MKKIIVLALAILMAVPVFAQGAQYRKKLREYKRDGWELFGSSRTLNDALRAHYSALETPGVFEVTGTASGVKSKAVGQQVAWNNACINYIGAAISPEQRIIRLHKRNCTVSSAKSARYGNIHPVWVCIALNIDYIRRPICTVTGSVCIV